MVLSCGCSWVRLEIKILFRSKGVNYFIDALVNAMVVKVLVFYNSGGVALWLKIV